MNRRRVFVVVWLALGLAGALDHTIATRAFGHPIDLYLPHLEYGYVMFNENPTRVPVFEYARGDGERHPLADLETRPAFGYKRARVALDAMFQAVYIRDLCNRALDGASDTITVFVDGYDVDKDSDHPAITSKVTCGARAPR